ncbi:MAG: ATP-binding protein [Polyangia bacterium]
MQALLREQRYRRSLLHDDRRQHARILALLGATMTAVLVNDIRLLRDSAWLYVALLIRLCIMLFSAVAALRLSKVERPRQHDRILGAWLVLITASNLFASATRYPAGEYLGPLFGMAALCCVYYFAMRGLILARLAAGLMSSLAAVVLLFSPKSVVTPVAKLTSSLAMLTLNLTGLVAARTFEEQRRKRWEAERHERILRQQLAMKVRELAVEKERAESLARVRTTFLAKMSHEFRTPMNAVIGLSDVVLSSPPQTPREQETWRYVHTMRDSARALLTLLNDILDLTKIDAQKLTLATAPFDLRRLLSSIFELLQPVAKEQSVDFLLDLQPEVPEWVIGDEARLRQVLVNLLSNALKFTDRGSVRLKVSGQRGEAPEPPAHTVTFRVEDTGRGMTADVIARLFRPFEQADEETRVRYGGTGLGLVISRQIVQAMGGDIHVESQPGRGSTFAFTLQLPTAATPAPALRDAPPGHTRPLALLVVDDDPINRFVAETLLKRLGHRAEFATTGEEAVAAVLGREYDAVFMDMQMPGMGGIDATRQIKRLLAGKPQPYIVAMTASAYEEDRSACLEAGMNDFISKPVDVATLAAQLAHIADERGRSPRARGR